jgi:hypothetical protein
MPTDLWKSFAVTPELYERIRQEAWRRSRKVRTSDSQVIREILDACLPPLEVEPSEQPETTIAQGQPHDR